MRKLKFLFVLLAMVSLASFGFEGENILSNEINAEISANVQVSELTDSIPDKTPLLFESKRFSSKFVWTIILAIIFGALMLSVDYIDKHTRKGLAPYSKDISKTRKTIISIIVGWVGWFFYDIARTLISPNRFWLNNNNSVESLHVYILYLSFLSILLLSVAIYVGIYRESYFNKIGKTWRIVRITSIFLLANVIFFNVIIDTDSSITRITFVSVCLISLVFTGYLNDKIEIIKPDKNNLKPF